MDKTNVKILGLVALLILINIGGLLFLYIATTYMNPDIAVATVASLLWITLWYVPRGVIKAYHLNKYGAHAWTHEHEKKERRMFFCAPLNFFRLWYYHAKPDILDYYGFCWK